MNIADLAAPFSGSAISWRAQSVTKQEPFKAMALAYIDARDVMIRLDEVCGPENWQDSYAETPSGRVICTISIRVGDEWVGKADGSGDSDIEGEKGGISGAFKRAAVKWGVGRYLYDMPCPWVECEVFNNKWKKWTPNGLRELAKVAGAPMSSTPSHADPEPAKRSAPAPEKIEELSKQQLDAIAKIDECDSPARLKVWKDDYLKHFPEGTQAEKIALAAFNKRKEAIRLMDRVAA